MPTVAHLNSMVISSHFNFVLLFFDIIPVKLNILVARHWFGISVHSPWFSSLSSHCSTMYCYIYNSRLMKSSQHKICPLQKKVREASVNVLWGRHDLNPNQLWGDTLFRLWSSMSSLGPVWLLTSICCLQVHFRNVGETKARHMVSSYSLARYWNNIYFKWWRYQHFLEQLQDNIISYMHAFFLTIW
jgi:hypothetical protein